MFRGPFFFRTRCSCYTFDNVPVTDVSQTQNRVIRVSANSFIMTFCVTLEQHACVVRMSLCVSYQGPAVVYIASRPDMTQPFLLCSDKCDMANFVKMFSLKI